MQRISIWEKWKMTQANQLRQTQSIIDMATTECPLFAK